MCHACQTAYTIKHVFVECIDLAPTREIFYSTSILKELFKKAKVDTIISFLKAGIYRNFFKSDNSENY